MQQKYQPPPAFDGCFGCLVVRPNHTFFHLARPDLASLAQEVAFWTVHNCISFNPCTVMHAWSPSGKSLDVLALAAYGRGLRKRAERPACWPRFRRGAIPGTGKGSGWCGFRYPKTQSERKAHALVMPEEGEPPVRAVRQPQYLPNAWDDDLRTTQRCWKRYRRQQYRA